MPRQSYSIHRWNSALYGRVFQLTDHLHTDLLVLADTLPNVAGYEAYFPKFMYYDGKSEKEGNFPLAVRLADGRQELWGASWHPVNPEMPLERARRAHARSLGADYLVRALRELEDNRIELSNRRTMQCFLFRGREYSTEILESRVLQTVATGSKTLAALAETTGASIASVQLAVFRLLRKCRVAAPICNTLISPGWVVGGLCHA